MRRILLIGLTGFIGLCLFPLLLALAFVHPSKAAKPRQPLSSPIRQEQGQAKERAYQAPEVAAAGDVYVPYFAADGFFVLQVDVSEHGEADGIAPLRNPGGMLEAAKEAVQSWQFQPALAEGDPSPSQMLVAFLYPTYLISGGGPRAQRIEPVLPASVRGDYRPPGIRRFAYPAYPAQSIGNASVVAQIAVDTHGNPGEVAIIHGQPGFNRVTQDAAKEWRFVPARFRGKPVESKVAIAVLFQAPASGD